MGSLHQNDGVFLVNRSLNYGDEGNIPHLNAVWTTTTAVS